MQSRSVPYVVLALVLVASALFALVRRDEAPPPAPTPTAARADLPDEPEPLPPDHPAIGNADPPEDEDEPALTWEVPASWKSVPSPSTMRIATYRVPRAAGDTDDADLSVTRVGGDKESNIERWAGQFEGATKPIRAERTVRGAKVTVVEIGGTFLGGGMTGNDSAPKKGWVLLAAIVEGEGTPYFFKLTGPAASVKAARPAFDALVLSFAPAR